MTITWEQVKRILLFIGIPLLALYVSLNWYQLMLIQGRSMDPTYKHMQMVVLNKHHRQFTHGDVVAFWSDGLSCIMVKRIAACPGDTVMIKEDTLYVNDEVSAVYPDSGCFAYAGILKDPLTLQPGEYLLLGDNTAESKDSRYPEVGVIPESKIYGRIAFPASPG